MVVSKERQKSHEVVVIVVGQSFPRGLDWISTGVHVGGNVEEEDHALLGALLATELPLRYDAVRTRTSTADALAVLG